MTRGSGMTKIVAPNARLKILARTKVAATRLLAFHHVYVKH
jgi:hypothetical protein